VKQAEILPAKVADREIFEVHKTLDRIGTRAPVEMQVGEFGRSVKSIGVL